MNPVKKIAAVFLSLLIALSLYDSRMAEAAASMQYPQPSSRRHRATASDGVLRSQLSSLYRTFTDVQEQLRQSDLNINAQHYKNEETKSGLTKQVKMIDADKIAKLEAAAKQAKDKYKPLFSMYTSINQQVKTANKLKNKQLSSALKAQADTMKVAVKSPKRTSKTRSRRSARPKRNEPPHRRKSAASWRRPTRSASGSKPKKARPAA